MKLGKSAAIVRLWARLRDALLRRAHATVAISAEIEAALAPPRRVEHSRRAHSQWTRVLDRRVGEGERSQLRRRSALPDGLLAILHRPAVARRRAADVAQGLVSASLASMQMRTWCSSAAATARSMAASRNCATPSARRTSKSESRSPVHVENVHEYLQACDLFVSLQRERRLSACRSSKRWRPDCRAVSTLVGVAHRGDQHSI
jgi:hypothetical protein